MLRGRLTRLLLLLGACGVERAFLDILDLVDLVADRLDDVFVHCVEVWASLDAVLRTGINEDVDVGGLPPEVRPGLDILQYLVRDFKRHVLPLRIDEFDAMRRDHHIDPLQFAVKLA